MNSSINVASKYLTRISVTVASTFTPKSKPKDGCSCFSSCSICVGNLNVSSVIVYRRSNVHHFILRWPSPTTTHTPPINPPPDGNYTCAQCHFTHKCQAFVHSLYYNREKDKKVIITCNTYVDDKMLFLLHIKTVSTAAFQSSSSVKWPWCWSLFLRTEHEHSQAEKVSFCSTTLSTRGWSFALKLESITTPELLSKCGWTGCFVPAGRMVCNDRAGDGWMHILILKSTQAPKEMQDFPFMLTHRKCNWSPTGKVAKSNNTKALVSISSSINIGGIFIPLSLSIRCFYSQQARR